MKRIIGIVLSVALCASLCGCMISHRGFTYKNAKKYSVGDASVSEKVTGIEVGWGNGDVTFVYGDGTAITASETSDKELSDEMRLHYWLDGETLRLQFCASGQKQWNDVSKQLTVTLPRGTELDEVKVATVSGGVSAEAFAVKTLEAVTVSGQVRLALTEAEKVKIATTSGAVDLSLNGNAKDADIATVSGAVKLILPPETGFTVTPVSVSGKFTCGFSTEITNGKHTAGDGALKLTLASVSGDLSIQPAETE